jgi:hypothetical protein
VKSNISTLAMATLAASLLLNAIGCNPSAEESAAENPALAAPVPDGMVRGTVLETMDAGGYTYVLLNLGEEQRWYAGPVTAIAVGDIVQTGNGMSMGAFTSKTLNRTFEDLYFVGALGNLSAPTLPQGHPTTPAMESSNAAAVADVEVAKLEDGQDIAYVYANKDSLAGQRISLRGKVVKYNANILGWNFIHLQDGSGDVASGSNDLTVTSHAETAVGDTIVVTGTVILDKDFGAGYSFPVLLEDASITTE